MAKIPKNWGLYRLIRKLVVRLSWQPDRLPVDRPGRPPTVRNMTVGQTRSTGPVDPNKQRADYSAPVDRPGRPPTVPATCTSLCTSVDRSGRPTSDLVDLSFRLVDLVEAWNRNLGQKHMLKYFLKIFYLFLKLP